jgi:hypothetical protein
MGLTVKAVIAGSDDKSSDKERVLVAKRIVVMTVESTVIARS